MRLILDDCHFDDDDDSDDYSDDDSDDYSDDDSDDDDSDYSYAAGWPYWDFWTTELEVSR